nr:sodium:solute symporter family protein [Brevibacillus sp. SYP-B805]
MLVTVTAGIAAKRRVKRASDFANAGGTLSSGMVAGALVGGFVGGTSIVGTGELAFRHGLSALWFTLGGGVAVMALGLFAERLRRIRVETLPALIGHEYGERARLGASLFLSLGMFIQVVAQILAALPILAGFWQGNQPLLALLPSLLILAYIMLGGFMGASLVGTIKTVLLIGVLFLTGGWLFTEMASAAYLRWWEEGRLSLFAGDPAAGWAQGAAMFIGIFSTQAYIQPIFASRSAQAARRGAFMAGAVIILIGLCSAWIGLYMHDIHPDLPPRSALPQFFLLHAPPWFAGIAYAVMLISVVMTGAALALSIGTILNQDVIQRFTTHLVRESAKLAVSRALILLVIALAYALVCLEADSLILHWAFLAMTLRGVTIFLPLMCYLLRLGPLDHRWVAWSVWISPMVALLWTWWGQSATGIDPIYVSGLWSAATLLMAKRKSPSLRSSG